MNATITMPLTVLDTERELTIEGVFEPGDVTVGESRTMLSDWWVSEVDGKSISPAKAQFYASALNEREVVENLHAAL